MNHPEHEWEQQREQLSALLDNELSAQERAALEAHLDDCDWCRVELESLRRTRILLHALPQPALPRNFTLPLEPIAAAASSRAMPRPEPAPVLRAAAAPAAAQRLTSLPGGRTVARRRPVQVLQWLSAIAAVVGIVVFLSGFFSTLPIGGHTANTAAFSSSNQGEQDAGAPGTTSPTHVPNVKTPSDTATGAETPAPTPPAPTVARPSSTPGSTPGTASGQNGAAGGSSGSPPLGQIISTTSVGLFLLFLSACGFTISWMLRRR